MKISFTLCRHLKAVSAFLFLIFFSVCGYAQQKEEADNLVEEGVAFQDKGDVDSAFGRYTQALKLDRDNLAALAEMAYSYLSVEKYDESIGYSRRAMKTHPHDPVLKTVYVSYGNALDGEGKPEKAIDIYNEGIQSFPDYYQLYYNKGISQIKLNKTGDALLSFERSATLNPGHASSHNAIGHLLFTTNKIPSLMAFCRFLILEPDSKRASANVENVKKMVDAHVSKTSVRNVTVSVSPDLLDTNRQKEKNNFSGAELMLALNASLDYDSINMSKTDIEKFIRKFSALCQYLKETEKDNYGFYWDYYVPYFTEMNDKGFTEVFVHIAFSSTENAAGKEWLNAHRNEIKAFYAWSGEFKWRIN
jgi:tetratricopeptide (TPR) repeat protein